MRATKSVNHEHVHFFTKLFDFIVDTGFSNLLQYHPFLCVDWFRQ